METAVAPNYANLFMDKFETRALKKLSTKTLLRKKFIDDIFLILTHGQAELDNLVTGPPYYSKNFFCHLC